MLLISIIGLFVCICLFLISERGKLFAGDIYAVSATLAAIFLCMFLLGASQ
jgi:hypothetical protein